MKLPVVFCLFSILGLTGTGAAVEPPIPGAAGDGTEEERSIRHRFLAVDDGTHTLHYVDQGAPGKNWKTPFGNYCMDMQLIGGGRVLLAVDDGYREFDLVTGKELKVFKGLGGKTHTVERLADGRTLLGGMGLSGVKDGFVSLDAQDEVTAKVPIPELSYIRHLRSTARGTLILAAVNKVAECTLEGKILWSAAVPGNNFKAVELDAACVMVSCGPGGRTLREIDHSGKVLREISGAHLPEGSFAGFQRLANNQIVVANWLGHGPNHDGDSIVECDAEGKIVWTYRVKQASFVEVIVLDGLDPKMLHAQQVNAIIAPVTGAKAPSVSDTAPKASVTPVTGVDEIHAQFDTLEAIRTRKRPSSRFAKPELTHRAESLIQAADRDPVDIVLRRTSALLRDIRNLRGARDLSAEATALAELQAENGRVAVTDVPARRALHLKCCELRRRIAFANPLLDFDRIVFITHKKNRRGELAGDHMAGQYYGIHASKGEGLFVLTDAFGAKPTVRNLLNNAVCRNGRFAGSKLPDGAYLSPDLSFDGKKVLFAYTEAEAYQPKQKAPEDVGGMYSYSGLQCSFTEQNCWHIFQVNADGTDLCNVTDGAWNDFDPCWMPNGRIAFISDRRGGFGRCHCSARGGAPWFTYTLHSVSPDGSGMARLSHHETCEWQPSITHEGLIVYTRWDYVDRGFFQAHHPWTTTPDGRNAMAVHGNYPNNWRDRPCMEMDIRSIPGSQRFVAVAAAHHGQTYGSIVLVDPQAEDDDAMAPVRLVTPEERFPESEYGYFCREAAYAAPWPLSEDYFICVYGYPEPGQRDGSVENYGIYLLDSFGNKELLYRDPAISCLSPIPLKARPTPPVVPEQVKPYPVDPNQRRLNMDRAALMAEAEAEQRKYESGLDKTEGIVTIANVYESRHAWPPGTRIASLRIVQVLPKSAPGRDNPKIGYATEKNARAVLGTVPVEEDGSISFKLPPYTPVYFQVLDKQGMAVQSMRTEIYVAPNEKLTCAGCHERRWGTPSTPKQMPAAMRREPSTIRPGPDGSNPFSFVRLVQPVLDRKCVSCHFQKKTAPAMKPKPKMDMEAIEEDSEVVLEFDAAVARGPAPAAEPRPSQETKGPVLTGAVPEGGGWSESYRNLGQYAFFYRDGSFVESKTYPGKFGAFASRLYGLLQKGHRGVKLTPEELNRITLWLDCNSDFYGTYENLSAQARGEIVRPVLR